MRMQKIIAYSIICILISIQIFSSSLLAENTDMASNSDPFGLLPGDIYVTYYFSRFLEGHSSLFIEYNAEKEEYIFITASMLNVSYQNISKEHFEKNEDLYAFLRVKTATQEQRNNAIEFAEVQLGKEFQFIWFEGDKKNYDPADTANDPLADKFYCTELVWAAYYNCNHTSDEGIYGEGIDLDKNEEKIDSKYSRRCSAIWTKDLLNDGDIEILKNFGFSSRPVKRFFRSVYGFFSMWFGLLFMKDNYST